MCVVDCKSTGSILVSGLLGKHLVFGKPFDSIYRNSDYISKEIWRAKVKTKWNQNPYQYILAEPDSDKIKK